MNEVMLTHDGLAVPRLSIKRLAVIQQNDGSKTLSVLDGQVQIEFILTEAQCTHLASLLSKPENSQPS